MSPKAPPHSDLAAATRDASTPDPSPISGTAPTRVAEVAVHVGGVAIDGSVARSDFNAATLVPDPGNAGNALHGGSGANPSGPGATLHGMSGATPVPAAAAPWADADAHAGTMHVTLPVELGEDEASFTARLELTGNDRYEKRGLLGAGGMGEVRLFKDRRIGRDVAWKTLHARGESPQARQRFLCEAQVQGQLDHPSVVPVFDMGMEPGGQLYFTMRKVNGLTLRRVIERLAVKDQAVSAAYSRRKLLTAFTSICLTIDYAHARGVIHRDLKPENVMLGAFGEVYVLDWGIAKLIGPGDGRSPAERPRRPGPVIGTPAYMAPEQVEGRTDDQDARTDVYALGCVLYELLTLQPLHHGDMFELIKSVLAGGDPAPSLPPGESLAPLRPHGTGGTGDADGADPDLPPELEAICRRATARDAAQRYGSARELADAIERYLDGDRDLTRRRELASELTRSAARRIEAVPTDAEIGRYAESREQALREVTRALALFPEEPEARQLLVRLMLEEPRETPPAVEADLERSQEATRHDGLRLGAYGLAGWVATIPFIVATGVRDWRPIYFAFALTLVAPAYVVYLLRRPKLGAHVYVITAIVAAIVASQSLWLGPFVLVPVASVSSTMWIAMHASRRERPLITIIGAAGVLLPFALEYAGLVPPSHVYENGNLVLLPRGMVISPRATEAALIYTSIAFVVLAALITGSFREALARAERKNFLQAWRLGQLVPKGARPERDGGGK